MDNKNNISLNLTNFIPVLQWLVTETNIHVPESVLMFLRNIAQESNATVVREQSPRTDNLSSKYSVEQMSDNVDIVSQYIISTIGIKRVNRINTNYIITSKEVVATNVSIANFSKINQTYGNISNDECKTFEDLHIPILLRDSYQCEVYYLAYKLLGEQPIWNFGTFSNWTKGIRVSNLWNAFREMHYLNNYSKWKNFRKAWTDSRYLLSYKYQDKGKVESHKARNKRQIWSIDSPLKIILSLISKHHSDNVIQNDINEHVLKSLQHSTSILNGSHVDIEQNRKAIDELILALNTWKSQWEILTYNMTQLQRRDKGLRLIIYAEILNALLGEFTEQILQKEMQINTVLNHKIDPTVIKPTILIDLLENITKQLPLNIFLPYKHDDLIAVYKSLDIATLATNKIIE